MEKKLISSSFYLHKPWSSTSRFSTRLGRTKTGGRSRTRTM